MKGDFSRLTFRPTKHYNSVRMQQGRVQTDADWNEQADIQAHLDRTRGADVIGACGVPRLEGGFELAVTPDGSDLIVSPGRLYADGILCELEQSDSFPGTVVSPNIVQVSALRIDDRDLEVGQWLELVPDVGDPGPTRIDGISDPHPDTETYNLTLSYVPPGATTVTLSRVITYKTQPDYPLPTVYVWPGPDVFDTAANMFPAIPDMRTLVISGSGIARAIAGQGPVTVYLDLHDPKTGTWVQVWDRTIADGDSFSFDDLTLTFPVQDVDGIQLRSSVAQNFTFLSWNRTQFTLRDPGTYIAYLDVWDQHLTAIEDPAIREVALGGPDTATRAKTLWQVKLLQVTDPDPLGSDWTCWDEPQDWTTLLGVKKGELSAHANGTPSTEDACIIAPSAGYRRLENQLYRVEIHRPSTDTDPATFKWSRDNATVLTRVVKVEPSLYQIQVLDVGKDPVLNFAPGQWIEVTDRNLTLQGRPGQLLKILTVNGNTLTIDSATWPSPDPVAGMDLDTLTARRWDHDGTNLQAGAVPAQGEVENEYWIDLEGGVQVRFDGGGDYKTGDYWLIPARVVGGDVEWPRNEKGEPIPQPPQGIEHHYCGLALVKWGGTPTPSFTTQEGHDCRPCFPAQNEPDLYYVSGDGQDALPGYLLPQPLVVGVAACNEPVEGAWIKFSVRAGEGGKVRPHLVDDGLGNLTSATVVLDLLGEKIYDEGDIVDPALALFDAFIVPSDVKGEARCEWKLGDAPIQIADLPDQQVEATLLRKPVDAPENRMDRPVVFGADFGVELYYVSGAGQEVRRNEPAPQPLQVRVANGQWPRQGVKVWFWTTHGEGLLSPNVDPPQFFNDKLMVETDENGLAECLWRPDGGAAPSQIATATLVDPVDPNDPTQQPPDLFLPGVVRFNGQLSIAEEVTYDGGILFPDTYHPDLEAFTVQQALDQMRDNTGMDHVSGDGQEAKPGVELPKPLQVRVANGQWPRRLAKVRFSVAAGNGQLTTIDRVTTAQELVVQTDTDGIAQVYWTPNASGNPSQQAVATLIDPSDPVSPPGALQGIVRFNANLSIAEQVAYTPMSPSTVPDVQAALDELYTIKVDRAGDTITGSLVIQGDLTVNGTTTTINTATLDVEDNIVLVNKYEPATQPNVNNAGLEVFRGPDPNAQVIWDETADQWNIGLVGNPFLSAGATGQVGIGIATPATTLHVNGGLRVEIGEGLEFLGDNDYFGASLDARVVRMIDGNSTAGVVDGGLAIEGYTPTDGVRKPILAIRGNGNVGIGTIAPSATLDVAGTLAISDSLALSGAITWDSVNTDWASIYFESTGDTPHLSNLVFETFDNADEGFIFRTTGIERARIDDRGLIVVGDIAATTKSFVIDHPSAQPPAGVSKLAHAVLEGPEHGVYYRGEATLDADGQSTITLPDYFEDLANASGRTVLLTAKGDVPFVLSYTDIVEGRFTVHGAAGGTFTWELKATRKDISALVVER